MYPSIQVATLSNHRKMHPHQMHHYPIPTRHASNPRPNSRSHLTWLLQAVYNA